MSQQPHVVVSGGFDNLCSRDLRFLEEAGKLGELTVLLWPDAMLEGLTGKPPKFPLAERLYVLRAVRYVTRVIETGAQATENSLPKSLFADIWADLPSTDGGEREQFCCRHNLTYRVFRPAELLGFPELPSPSLPPGRKKVIVTGCYDWFHSGHVRFFEEVSAYGDLYVIVGHDANIRMLKGPGHPLLPQEERRYLVGSVRYVTQALVSTGDGWLDAEPEILRLKPDIYAVNEDGDKGGKREYCEKRGLQYLVLRRTPAPGLARRSSTDLRGF
jgi:cytidyltransferase-like protein